MRIIACLCVKSLERIIIELGKIFLARVSVNIHVNVRIIYDLDALKLDCVYIVYNMHANRYKR